VSVAGTACIFAYNSVFHLPAPISLSVAWNTGWSLGCSMCAVSQPDLKVSACRSRSIRISLLSTAEQKALGEKKPLKSVQLRARHWRMRNAAGAVLDEIRGDGVIGQFPILKAGAFCEQWCLV